jgi:hypothetical protein
MKTNNNGMFIALKYGAAAMAGATASYMYLKQEHELALLLARGEAVDARAARLLRGRVSREEDEKLHF